MWPGTYWLKSSLSDDSLTDIMWLVEQLFGLPGLYLKLK
jgi:hypothetical protein